MPKVSIRIMTYNSERFIAKALDSCLDQTFQDFEICVADDASSDNTVEIVTEYQKKYPGIIKLLVQPMNMGTYSLAINANAGRKLCEGDYISILDGDEYMEPTRLEKQVAFLERNPETIAVSHPKKHIDYQTGERLTAPHTEPSSNEITTKELILRGNVFHNCYTMRNVGLLGDHSLKAMADWEYIIRLSMQGKLHYQKEELTVKYWHGENVTLQRKQQFAEDKLISLALLEYRYPELLRYIDRVRMRYYLTQIAHGKWQYLRGIFSFRTGFMLHLFMTRFRGNKSVSL